ncbi:MULTISPECIES: LPS O-antigen length regulator Wzz(fepE) [Citrobacter]|uniref:LPS O-antigen length regulator Wzz(fepE) n=1 Tax=Citrobacter TaxID=544 RepID=UPI0005A96CD2|nr:MULTISPECIES: LPS O-antigen length regulator Wzz(fepE) [Citrobacter]EHG7582505.1 LPS O-antigen length regulator [Citrobacter sedlakii]EHG7612068.1 LPS O-antigen length regulator [Citrobacter sedlakii]EIQ7158797.1 LPS O-antigen length regulator [Citrobacter sedlakii]EKJ8218628.1 LPS O-antigen length regulator [Citrobacter sedlakii]KSY31984.1 O-antigen chain length regulator [Citrobacter sp. 50677481]
MSTMDIKKNTELNFADYAPPAVRQNEIDLLRLVEILFSAKNHIIAVVFACALLGAAVSWLLPQKWTSQSVVTPAEQTQWYDLRQTLADLQILGVEINISRGDVFNLFIKKLQSQSLLEEYLKTSPYVMGQLKDADIDPLALHRAVVNVSEKLKVTNNATAKNADKMPYDAWTLSFTAPTAKDAQTVLDGYIGWVSAIVQKETMQNVRNALELKTRIMKEQLALDHVRLTNAHNTNLQRLSYSLEVANAAGIKQPVFSNGQAVKDDPDYSVTLGANGIARKLQIEESLQDVAELNADFKNREYLLGQLQQVSLNDVKFAPFRYQMSPSLPIRKDGPGRLMIITLAMLLGGMFACGGVLLREAIKSRSAQMMPVLE